MQKLFALTLKDPMNVHAQTDLLKMENSASVIITFFFAQSFGELITATLFGNITCLILKNSYSFYYFYDNDNNSETV